MTPPRVVIIGAGIVGAGLADELTERGWTDVTVLEQGRLFAAGGSTSHAPGPRLPDQRLEDDDGVRPLHGREVQRPRARRPVVLPPGRRARGRDDARAARGAAAAPRLARRRGASTAACSTRTRAWPPGRCSIATRCWAATSSRPTAWPRPSARARRRRRRAIERGARFLGEQTVTGDPDRRRPRHGRRHRPRRVPGRHRRVVRRASGARRSGRWSAMRTSRSSRSPTSTRGPRQVPALAAMAAPDELENLRPILRHQDRDLYFREHVDRLGVGGLRPSADAGRPGDAPRAARRRRSCRPCSTSPRPTSPSRGAGPRSCIPALRDAEIEEGINGVFSFTPDGIPLMGESPDVARLLGGRGRLGHPLGGRRQGRWPSGWSTAPRRSTSTSATSNRFEPHQVGAGLHPRAAAIQNFVEVYDILHPLQPMELPRPLRDAPVPRPARRSWAPCSSRARLGAAALVRGERRPARAVRGPDPRRAATGRRATGRRSPGRRRWRPATASRCTT